MTNLEDYISNSFGITTNLAKSISHLFIEEQIKKGESFVTIDSRCNKLSFIHEGLFRIYRYNNGKEVTQWISTPGYFITELNSWLFNHNSRLNIQAITDSTIYTITKVNYHKINNIVTNWNQIEKQFIGHCFITLEERIFSFLSMSSEERYNLFYEHNKALFNQVPLQHIASMLGMTPETFSRIRKKQLS